MCKTRNEYTFPIMRIKYRQTKVYKTNQAL